MACINSNSPWGCDIHAFDVESTYLKVTEPLQAHLEVRQRQQDVLPANGCKQAHLTG